MQGDDRTRAERDRERTGRGGRSENERKNERERKKKMVVPRLRCTLFPICSFSFHRIYSGVWYTDKAGEKTLRDKIWKQNYRPGAAVSSSSSMSSSSASSSSSSSSSYSSSSSRKIVLTRPSDIAWVTTTLDGISQWFDSQPDSCEYVLPDIGNSFLRKALLEVVQEQFPTLVYESRPSNLQHRQQHISTPLASSSSSSASSACSSSSPSSSSASSSSSSSSSSSALRPAFLRLNDEQKLMRASAQERTRLADFNARLGFRRLWLLLCQAKKPMVGHHCFYDLLFMFRAFEGLPTDRDGSSDEQ